ncbi:MAG: hypothetical protein M1817_001251 [Caeruleum heppii]|nr:MAG: hypothetical protein M1817_001251 [Caeruleum heppii]
MASTRPTRRSSRKPSPSVRKRETTDAAGRDGPITIPSSQPEKPVPAVMPQETANPVKQTFLDQWIEPPLRTPAPSFQDYKGLERQGVLLNMQPLGAMPPAKLTAKTKTDSSNRVSKSKNKKAKKAKKRKGARNGVSTNGTTVQTTPDPVVTPARRSVSTKAEDRASKTPSGTRGTMLEQLITSKTPTKSPVKPSIAPSPSQSLLSGRASNGKAGIDAVVTKAIEKATAAGQDTLVLALQKLYADSQEDASFTELLEAVLTQTANITQVADFQKYMKVARALSKSNASKANHSRPSSAEETTPGSMESSKKSTQRILLRMGADPRKTPVEKERDIKARPVEAETAATNDSSHDGMVSQPNKAPKMKKGPKKGVPTVRIPNPRDGVQTRASSASMSRSSSNQSSSALSSVGSVGPEQALAVGSRSSSTLTRKNKMVPISKTANGPITTNGADASDASSISNQLHRHPPSHSSRSSPITQPATAATTASGTTTTTTNHTASKRSSTNAGLDTADVENGAAVETSRKRPRKTKSFGGYAVEDSFVRSVAESDLATATATTTKSAVRPKRLLDGTFKGVTGDASNQSGVPSASNVGDDGSGPATAELDSASRPGTPHASGRPAKKAKKTPRVKMS